MMNLFFLSLPAQLSESLNSDYMPLVLSLDLILNKSIYNLLSYKWL